MSLKMRVFSSPLSSEKGSSSTFCNCHLKNGKDKAKIWPWLSYCVLNHLLAARSAVPFQWINSLFWPEGAQARNEFQRKQDTTFDDRTPKVDLWDWKVELRLPGKGDSNSHGARLVHLIITMITWIRTSRLSINNSLSLTLGRSSIAMTISSIPSVDLPSVNSLLIRCVFTLD